MNEKLPDGWEWKKLEDIAEIRKGNSITKSIIEEGNIPVIAGGREPAYYHNKPNRDGETITVSASGAYAGYVNYFCTPIFASDCSTIKVINSDALSTKFIYWRLKSHQEQIYALQKGGGQPHVYPKDLMDIQVPLPPLDVQQKIVSILEKAEETKRLRAQADELTQQLLKSVFLEMFGDPVLNTRNFKCESLGEICELKSGGTPSRKIDEYFIGDIPWITTVALGSSYIGYKDASTYISNEAITNSATKLIPKNSIMIGVRVGVGKCSINVCDMCTNQDIVSLVNLEQCLIPEFLLHVLRFYEDYFLSQVRGATIQGITSLTLRQLKIIIPSLQLQELFVQIKTNVELTILRQVESGNHINTLFDSLMQKAFTGELVS